MNDIDIGRSLSFITEDEQWISKVLIGGLILLIPIVGQIALLGYMIETAQNVTRGREKPLPEWGEFGSKMLLGFHAFLISLVYSLPVVLLVFIFVCFIVAMSAGAEGREEELAGGIAAAMFCLIPLLVLLGLLIQVATFAGWVRYIRNGADLGSAFAVGPVWEMLRDAPGTWVITFLVYLLFSLLGSLGSVACGVGALFTTMYAFIGFGHVLGQLAGPAGGTGGTGGSNEPIPSPSGGWTSG
jgi:hypothetical protein